MRLSIQGIMEVPVTWETAVAESSAQNAGKKGEQWAVVTQELYRGLPFGTKCSRVSSLESGICYGLEPDVARGSKDACALVTVSSSPRKKRGLSFERSLFDASLKLSAFISGMAMNGFE